MTKIRRAANAGAFYPADRNALAGNVTVFVGGTPADEPIPKALIAPHAGYVYSGEIAGAAYRLLAPARGKVSRVVLLGPSHRFAFAGMAATSAQAYETPLGVVPIDQKWLDRARDVPSLGFFDEAHEAEHCLETHLPFLQLTLGDFKLIPIICGRASGEQVAALLDRLWGGPETVVVVSSDLSHYLDYEACRARDEATRAAIERLDPVALTSGQACGAVPVNGLLIAARRRRMRVKTLDLRNSGDTAGPRDRVVGYGAWAFWEQETAIDIGDDTVRRHGVLMNDVARGAICGAPTPPERLPAAFSQPGACFVTLRKAGVLRGCCGSVIARRPLLEDIKANALNSAFEDPRFAPLESAEWTDVSISVTLLTPPQEIRFENETDLLVNLQPHRDGLVIEDAGRRAVFLPAVWKTLPGRQEFLAHLKVKAGLSRAHWSPNFRASRFLAMQTLEEKLRLA